MSALVVVNDDNLMRPCNHKAQAISIGELDECATGIGPDREILVAAVAVPVELPDLGFGALDSQALLMAAIIHHANWAPAMSPEEIPEVIVVRSGLCRTES